MSLKKRAKLLAPDQQDLALEHVRTESRYPVRDRVILLLSFKAGMRACEIAGVTWMMVLDADGKVSNTIALSDIASKGKRGGRPIPMHDVLREALIELWNSYEIPPDPEGRVVRSERGGVYGRKALVIWFMRLFRRLGFLGASSHSGRRSFLTKAARAIYSAGGSLKDVQELAGHASLTTTQNYIEGDAGAKRKMVDVF